MSIDIDIDGECKHDFKEVERHGRPNRIWKIEYECEKCGGQKIFRSLSF